MKRIVGTCIALLCLTIVSHSQTPEKITLDSLVTVKIKCINDSLSLQIPSGQYKIQRSWYVEGSVVSIIYTDRSTISILCGHSAVLQLNDKKEDVFGRKTETKGRTIIYENVKADRLDIFNKAFDLMEQQ